MPVWYLMMLVFVSEYINVSVVVVIMIVESIASSHYTMHNHEAYHD